MQKNALQVGRRVVDQNLLERLAVFGEVLDVVVADAEIENIAADELAPLVAVVDVHRAAQYVSDGIARQGLRLDAGVKRFDILHDHRLLGRRIQ